MEYVIKVEKLSKSYKSCVAVENLSFAVKKGTVFGLLGANGAGKSTSIECILGTKKIYKGGVSILGLNPISNRKEVFERVGVQFQEANYQENIRVEELCEMTASLYKNPANYKELLQRFGIEEKSKTLVKALSG